MDERVRFVARLLEGEGMAALCREFAISRKTGYKIFDRYKESGLEALTDRSRRPWRYGHQLPHQVETAILHLKQEKPHWGALKIRERLLRRFSCEVKVPARSTIHAVLDRHGLVRRRGPRRNRAQGTSLSLGQAPNELWCTDYKGEFLLGNKKYCYPLTVTDHASRYLLLCEALESTCESLAFTAFERLFQERGLPQSIRSDNGVPFASANSLFNLSKLSVWWLRLGLTIERIRPGHPQQNGRHERMHLTLKNETTRPAGMNSLQQQTKFDDFLEEFNNERPHQALDVQCPTEVYSPSTRPYRGPPELTIVSTTKPSTSPAADVSVCTTKKSISARSSLFLRHSASRVLIFELCAWHKYRTDIRRVAESRLTLHLPDKQNLSGSPLVIDGRSLCEVFCPRR
jgi:transposase InsO family protein